jgi:hypothetical protein
VLATAALGGRFVWIVPLVPPLQLDLGSTALLAGAVAIGIRAARANGAADVSYLVTATLVTVLFVLMLHGYVPQEPGAVLDVRAVLLLASGVIAAGVGRRPAVACTAAATAYVAVLARDWLLLQRNGYTAVPLPVGGYGLDLLVLSLLTAAVAAVLWPAVATGQVRSLSLLYRRGGGSA